MFQIQIVACYKTFYVTFSSYTVIFSRYCPSGTEVVFIIVCPALLKHGTRLSFHLCAPLTLKNRLSLNSFSVTVTFSLCNDNITVAEIDFFAYKL
jgi:hypothetical protein